ncbi:lytic transglycosylase domain-containing protein [Noviherbaspirillum aridicola]|uniref:Lytic transglycosylase n=1 Tax=Noviherbaspirillum aridicola TaxID=2849687 RepID=A0ABQ4Q0X4_9BURK|nr:lytic transglycosylase domain-containing protein [Noviherbaspirillum aridicola]GIZ50804.1 lytic transglycosylase [Noviherbaspirillum aridicola]
MLSPKWIAGVALATASVVLVAPAVQAKKPAAPSAPTFASDDEVFMALREAARNNDAARAADLAARLGNYAIPSYVDYYRLRPRILSAPEQEIRDYLARYEGQAIADRLRNDWLLELGRSRNWTLFDEQYPQFVLNDDLQLKCYALMSKALKGQKVADEARALLVTPQNYGEACPALIATLVEAGQFDADDVWAQVRLASELDAGYVIRRLAPLTDVAEATLMQAYDKPATAVARGPGGSRGSRETFIVALGRVARSDIDAAIKALTTGAERLNEKERAHAWAQVAYAASFKLMPEAPVFWRRTDGVPLSLEAHRRKARMALRAGEWKQLRDTIEAMPSTLRTEPTWIYWQARALHAEGRKEEAQKLFESISDHTGFYGQLAVEELGRKISVPPRPAPVGADEVARMAGNEGLQRALKFFDMNLRFEGVREWNWELRKMNDRQLLAAAEFARQKNVLDRMVNTSERTKAELDFTQRFPTPFRDIMTAATSRLGLDMAWVYGLIRQESRFLMNARSHVGASGLMQVMPATAKWVARKIGLADFTPHKMNDVDTNIMLGTNYLNMVLNDLEGSQAMATAAYNAGPGRPRAWRSTLTGAIEGAVFAESIPFNETRDYVKNVLSNATYYAALFEGKPQSLKARLGTVAPRGFEPSELP